MNETTFKGAKPLTKITDGEGREWKVQCNLSLYNEEQPKLFAHAANNPGLEGFLSYEPGTGIIAEILRPVH